MNPAPIPWILCGPGAPPEMTGECVGSTATILRTGFFGFQKRPTPVIVPPVPTPATKTSILPSVSFQSSAAVVASWIAGFAGFSNCCGWTPFGPYSARSSCAFAIAPFMPIGPGVSTTSAPRSFRTLRRSTDIVSGIVRMRR